MLRSVDISDYMIHRPVKIHAEDDMSTAIGLVLDNKISGICVVNEHGDLVGVLSEMDCLKAILNATYNESGDLGRAGDYMTKDIEYCDIHADLIIFINVLCASKICRVKMAFSKMSKIIIQFRNANSGSLVSNTKILPVTSR